MSTAPSQFNQFNERTIAGPGTYRLPQWDPTGKFLAFIDDTDGHTRLRVFDIQSKQNWIAAEDVKSTYFDWNAEGRLTYLRYRPELSGSPLPAISDLHRVDADGNNDQVIVDNLHSAGSFRWFDSNQKLVILLATDDSRAFCQDVYLLDSNSGERTLLVSASEVDLTCFGMLDLSSDATELLLYGNRESQGSTEALLIVYDLRTRKVVHEIAPSRVIPSGDAKYPKPGIGDYPNFGWIGRTQWVLATANTPSGSCYNYSLFFFNLNNLQESFCLLTASGIVAEPIFSPDTRRIAYITEAGPSDDYVVIGEITPSLWKRLGIVADR